MYLYTKASGLFHLATHGTYINEIVYNSVRFNCNLNFLAWRSSYHALARFRFQTRQQKYLIWWLSIGLCCYAVGQQSLLVGDTCSIFNWLELFWRSLFRRISRNLQLKEDSLLSMICSQFHHFWRLFTHSGSLSTIFSPCHCYLRTWNYWKVTHPGWTFSSVCRTRRFQSYCEEMTEVWRRPVTLYWRYLLSTCFFVWIDVQLPKIKFATALLSASIAICRLV